ncbi:MULTISPECIES: response regulator [Thermodesulfovibrio]|uniref:Sporulation initiation phosphotransferase F n=1 Tax=Thermodesulfovibrio yellowstonii (strain ATCC 51303 / DSM 11347 / YP87) TaxID=289376 RepID=B5YK18_THEYD|nr:MULTISPECIES: response regulator [Thermodesulfovibrio]ACI20420.1 sporulation initiation phosphotransferase F [Thermodesulfovibrio yellowstonii DSM 11347]MDI6864845.1 response regulator [Thermodesulfovibrio yellowstonii]
MKKAKLLIIDDEQELVTTLAERLNLRGYDANGVTSFSEAITFIKQIPDVIILDIGLQDTDGLEVLKRIKEINPSIQVIMLSGYGDNERINKSLQNGAFDYLIKPVDIEELVSKINSAKLKKEEME